MAQTEGGVEAAIVELQVEVEDEGTDRRVNGEAVCGMMSAVEWSCHVVLCRVLREREGSVEVWRWVDGMGDGP